MTSDAVVLPPRGSIARRRMGVLLAAFGVVGLLLVGTPFFLVVRPVDADEGPFGIETQRRQLVALLDAARDAIASAQTPATAAAPSHRSTAVAAGSAATLMNELSTTMRELAGSLRVSFLGTQPFAPAADDMDRVADQAATVAGDLDVAASSVRLAAEDMAALARDLREMRGELSAIRSSMSGPIEADAWRLLVAAMLAWLGIPAAVSLVVGLRWLRPAPRFHPARSTPAGRPVGDQGP